MQHALLSRYYEEYYKYTDCVVFSITAQKNAVKLMFGGSSEYEGLVRLTTDEGLTGLVCNDEDSWSLTEANIVCMQLFGTAAISTTSTVCITMFCLKTIQPWWQLTSIKDYIFRLALSYGKDR